MERVFSPLAQNMTALLAEAVQVMTHPLMTHPLMTHPLMTPPFTDTRTKNLLSNNGPPRYK